ncbi:uncharacterized protein N7483_001489 [Penicillium malachiteum]|uniref:uncharacterized protein n=1 Tax=Penicillium malachiteum TaxID=1324776 RepID=UPI002549A355|nr:uncharacterized protein N7483_001489 [Penicillium malachiteum]KAJ5736364.1 hypothetical protein N7483_001489 [Penicillium malachiteum]
MKPVVSALNAWSCLKSSVIISVFAIVILSVLGSLFSSNNHSYTGSEGEPEDGPAVAASIYVAVLVYAGQYQETQANSVICNQGFLVFCGFQVFLHRRASRGGAISLN